MADRRYTEEMVETETEDGLLLEGAIIRPIASPRPLGIVWVHGLTSRYYSRTALRVGRTMAERGYTFVTGNNRGHDFGALVRRREGGPLLAGGSWELFHEAPYDVAAWIDFTAGLGFDKVVIVGHSLGARKVAYYQAERQDGRVAGLVSASAPMRGGFPTPELLARAEQMAAEGRGQDLLPWGSTTAGAGTLSAHAYLDRQRTNVDTYGTHTPNPAIARVRCPILAIYGTEEEWVGGPAELETIRTNARLAPSVEARMFAGADHSYTDHEAEVGEVIAAWVDNLR